MKRVRLRGWLEPHGIGVLEIEEDEHGVRVAGGELTRFECARLLRAAADGLARDPAKVGQVQQVIAGVGRGPIRRVIGAVWQGDARYGTAMLELACGHRAAVREQLRNEHGVGRAFAHCGACGRELEQRVNERGARR